MAVASASYRGGALPQPDSSNSLLSVEDGIATISIEGPILRKPGLFARVIMGATDSEEIGAAIREANDRADINKWGQSSRIHIRLVNGVSPRGFTYGLYCYVLWSTQGHGKTYKIPISRGGLPCDGAW